MTISKAVETLRAAGYQRSSSSPLIWKKIRNKKVCVATVQPSSTGDSVKIKYHNA